MDRVLVTGASGFIGSHIAHWLHSQGWIVRGMVRRGSGRTTPGFPVMYGDLLDEESLDQATRGVDTIIHCAGLVHNPSATLEEHLRVNVEGTRSLLCQAVRNGVRQFVFMSSISVYGKSEQPYREEHALRPVTPYGYAKAEAEKVCNEIASREGMRLVVFRLSTVYGTGEPGNVSRLIRAVQKIGPVVIGDGKNQKSLTYVQNVAELCGHVMRNYPGRSVTCNVSDPRPYTLSEIVETIAKVLTYRGRVRYVPRELAILGAQALSLGFRLFCRQSPISPQAVKVMTESAVCDTSRLKRELGFEAPILLEEGLKLTIAGCTASVRP